MTMTARRFLSLGLFVLAAGSTGCGASDTEPPPQTPAPLAQPDELGPWAVGHALIEVTSGARTLPVDVWWPAESGEGFEVTEYPLNALSLPSEVAFEGAPIAAGSFPLLVFSHGYQAIATQSIRLTETLASHGFVVAAPEHVGNSLNDPSDDFDAAAGHRVPDISAVIDGLGGAGTPVEGSVDAETVGVLGHSMGGSTTVGAGAGWGSTSPDPRVDALMPISAVIDWDLEQEGLDGYPGFSAEQLASISQPVLLLGGTADEGVPVENNGIAFDAMTGAETAIRVDIIGANHTAFANVCDIGDRLIALGFGVETWEGLGAGQLIPIYEETCGPDAFPVTEVQRLQNLYAVAFFRRFLLGEEAYGEFLTDQAAQSEEAVIFWRR